MKSILKPMRLILPALLLAFLAGSSASALTINFTYDSDANFMAAGLTADDIPKMKAANTFAAKQLTDRYNDNINVNIMVNATPASKVPPDFGASSTTFDSVDTYDTLRGLLTKDAVGADDATTISSTGSVPAGPDPIAGAHSYQVTRAQAKALGHRPDDMEIDGTFTFGGGVAWTYDPNNRSVPDKNDFIGVALHEYSEIMGRNSLMGNDVGLGTPAYCEYDLFHYTGPGARALGAPAGRGPG